MADSFDEDREIRDGLSVLPLDARVQLERVLEWPPEKRGEFLRRVVGRPDLEHLATLVSMAETSNEVRLRLLRALRDLDMTQR
jgi:16S rRNA G527 N7-methylase RsmG